MTLVQQKIANFKIQRIFNLTLVLFLITLSVIYFDTIRAKIKDTKRKVDIRQLQTALNIYQSIFNSFPEVTDSDFDGWDTTYEPMNSEFSFINNLTKNNLISPTPKDPINSARYYYRYKKFPRNSFGCKNAFYILQIMNFENNVDNHGWGECPERNFANEAPNGFTVQVFE
ncbi:hypothetical protein KKC16_02200 [Patescibacteria group bacterium]|nr:hypothetical protein [Patescibacteria group bacterium]MBU4482240.1 hypothetical protein [Patescibacteria group bacterium]